MLQHFSYWDLRYSCPFQVFDLSINNAHGFVSQIFKTISFLLTVPLIKTFVSGREIVSKLVEKAIHQFFGSNSSWFLAKKKPFWCKMFIVVFLLPFFWVLFWGRYTYVKRTFFYCQHSDVFFKAIRLTFNWTFCNLPHCAIPTDTILGYHTLGYV